jgi:3-isopropylmalate dehydrogenase
MIVRELTSGVYFGEPRGIITEGNERVGINTQRYTESEIARVARSAFELARKRNNKVCSMEKANVMESGVLWRDVVTGDPRRRVPGCGAQPHVCRRRRHAAGALAQAVRRDRDRQPVRRPAVGPRRDADRLARHAALGLARRADGERPAQGALRAGAWLGPDIAGQGKANPIACILSFAMALRYSFDLGRRGDRLEQAVEAVLADGLRTADLLGEEGVTPVSTRRDGRRAHRHAGRTPRAPFPNQTQHGMQGRKAMASPAAAPD